MSTILDALRKVERERDESPRHRLDAPTITPDVRRRRTFPLAAVALCAVIGFSGGAILSWWMPSEAPIESAELEPEALPVPAPPPEIPVPRAPVRAQPKKEPPVVVVEHKAASEPANGLAPAAAPPTTVQAPASEAVPAAVPPAAAPPLPPAEQAPGDVVVAKRVPEPPPIDASRPLTPERGTGDVLAALEKRGSALEPSPFNAPRDQVREGTATRDTPPVVAPMPAPVAAPVRPPVAAPVPPKDPDQEIAAVAPAPPPEAPPLEEAPAAEGEAEPEAPAETLVDTGRSPPGAPKVALSFLQWSADPAKRFAFVSIDGAPSQRVHEGEVAAGLTVAAITPGGVQFKREGTTFVIRPRH